MLSTPSTQEFFSDCVRLNRPCVIQSLANSWPAYTKWNTKHGGKTYLKEKLTGRNFKYYQTESFNSKLIENKRYHFNAKYSSNKTYSDFLDSHDQKPDYTAFKDSVLEVLKDDVEVPDFMVSAIALKDIELLQGANFVDKPRYLSDEQLVCAIEGNLSVALVPHVFRQEIMGGKASANPYYLDGTQPFSSPLNFWYSGNLSSNNTSSLNSMFDPLDYFSGLATKQYVKYVALRAGDCLFIPAFYFY